MIKVRIGDAIYWARLLTNMIGTAPKKEYDRQRENRIKALQNGRTGKGGTT